MIQADSEVTTMQRPDSNQTYFEGISRSGHLEGMWLLQLSDALCYAAMHQKLSQPTWVSGFL